MKVIKLGGSLISDKLALMSCLNAIDQNYAGKIVIVPGGGVFADKIRSFQQEWGFNDEIAHRMALLAMQQMALLLYSIKQNFVFANNILAIKQALINHSIVIWNPSIEELNYSDINASWDVTSDSLSAWLANQLTATELILVKSAEIPIESDRQQMQKKGLLDKSFNEFTQKASYKITIINKHRLNEYLFP